MKLYLTLALLCIGINAEKKINLEDIERDNLRAEGSRSKPGNSRPEEQKYLAKPEIGQQQYQAPSQYSGPPNPPVTYVTPSPVPSQTYVHSNNYAVRQQTYQQPSNFLPKQIPPQRYYNEYQQQSSPSPKGFGPEVYETQQFALAYQPEVNVGNQLQSVQQKTVTAKYSKNLNKDIVYVDIPTMRLLAYYPNLDVNSGKSSGLLVPQLNTAATEHISIPLYTSTFSQKPFVSLKPTYQIQYAPKYNAAPSFPATTKVTKDTVYATIPVAPKKFASSPLVNVPTYVPSDQLHAQGRQLLYTQAYIAPSQPQYIPQLVYTQPATVYMHATPLYNDIYTRPSSYVQDNSLHSSSKYRTAVEHSNTVAPVDESPNQVLAQQTSQSVSQNYVEDSDEPSTDLVPPQQAAQNFKSSVTPLLPVSSQEEEYVPDQNHVGPSEPTSLLDSYVPSKLIAAQDSARYQERPIKLEGGFLPSKENFLHKKRKTD